MSLLLRSVLKGRASTIQVRTRELSQDWRQGCLCTTRQTRRRAKSLMINLRLASRYQNYLRLCSRLLSERIISVICNKGCSKGVKLSRAPQRYCFEIAWVRSDFTNYRRITKYFVITCIAHVYVRPVRTENLSYFEINHYWRKEEIGSFYRTLNWTRIADMAAYDSLAKWKIHYSPCKAHIIINLKHIKVSRVCTRRLIYLRFITGEWNIERTNFFLM